MQAQTPDVGAEKATTPAELRLVSVEQLKKIHRDLGACQKVIWLAGCRPHGYGFDPSYVTDAQERLKEIETLIVVQAPAQEQINLRALLNNGTALSNIAYNLAQRPGVTLDKIVCDTLLSACRGWDAACATLRTEGGE